MATGYVHEMLNKDMDFNDFVWNCARGFGALVTMRDDPMDAPIPENFEPSDYHSKKITEARRLLKKLKTKSLTERIQYGEKHKAKEIKLHEKYLRKQKKTNQIIDAMIEKVAKWEPPSEDHTELKKFMIDQLKISRDEGDYWEKAVEKAKAMKPLDYFQMKVDQAEHDIVYHTEENKKEIERTNDRNKWLKTLRDSVPLPKAKKLV